MTPVELQTALAAEGVYDGAIDGLVGVNTLNAIRVFQAEQGLAHTGQVDGPTLEALDKVLHRVPGVPLLPVEAAALIAAWEGIGDGNPATVELEPYWDASLYATVGYGHLLLDPMGQKIQAKSKTDPAATAMAQAAVVALFGKPAISFAQAQCLLSIDINRRVAQIAPLLQGVPTTQKQFDALLALTFNIGAKGLSNSTVLARHKAGQKVSANINIHLLRAMSELHKMDSSLESAFTAWSFSAGVWLLGLFRRHLCEAMVYRGDALAAALAVSKTAT